MPMTLELLKQDCFDEGFAKGFREGREEVKRETIAHMYAIGRTKEYICKQLEIDMDYVDEVLKEAAESEDGQEPAESDK